MTRWESSPKSVCRQPVRRSHGSLAVRRTARRLDDILDSLGRVSCADVKNLASELFRDETLNLQLVGNFDSNEFSETDLTLD